MEQRPLRQDVLRIRSLAEVVGNGSSHSLYRKENNSCGVQSGGGKSKVHEKASKAIGSRSGYTGGSIALLFTTSGKGNDKWYCAIYHIIRSCASLSGRVYYSVELSEEEKTVEEDAVVRCEGGLVPDLYGQTRWVRLKEGRRTIKTFIGVEWQESHDPRSYAYISDSKRLGPDGHSITWSHFIQATSDAVLPGASSTNPLEVVSPIFF
jgi:hypothetical protein